MLRVILIATIFVTAYGAEWGYDEENGPHRWPGMFPRCGGRNQSPVNIVKRNLRKNNNLGPIQFINYDVPLRTLKIENNGETIKIYPPSGTTVAITGGGMGGVYRLLQCHFHWGTGSRGSEHTINGVQYALETHCVHMNEIYSSVNEALQSTNGISVLGVLHCLSEKENDFLRVVTDSLRHVTRANTTTEVILNEPLDLTLLLPRKTESYYRYNGSLTTPECNEAVIWTIFTEKLTVTNEQLQKFREALNPKGEHLTHNFRPTQPLNGRRVQCSRNCLRKRKNLLPLPPVFWLTI